MKTLLWLGSPFFLESLKRLLARDGEPSLLGAPAGQWRVIHHAPAPDAFFVWEDCVRLAGGEPDILVVGDNSRPPFVLGVEHFPCLTFFYAVDTHIHSWIPWYAQAFDACLVSLRDHLPRFGNGRLPEDRIWWSPPYAPDLTDEKAAFPEKEKRWNALFVGTVDPVRTPLRVRFVERLQTLVPGFDSMFGDFLRLYPQTETAINFCEHGDLNFRVFESMGCGTALVTPLVGHGLTDLFLPGRHLAIYEGLPAPDRAGDTADLSSLMAGDAPEQAAERAAEAINNLLADEDLRRAMARNGWDEINRAHRARHRAGSFLTRLRALPQDLPDRRRKEAGPIRQTFLRLPYLLWCDSLPDSPLREAYMKASRGEL